MRALICYLFIVEKKRGILREMPPILVYIDY